LPPAHGGGDAAGSAKGRSQGGAGIRNVWIIWRKELRSYFVSPIAYLLLTMFAAVSAFFFWIFLRGFVEYGMEMQMRGEMFPMNINEQVIRPLLSNASVIGLFFIPMITMRCFAEEKRTGTIELLATSPVSDAEIIIGKSRIVIMGMKNSPITLAFDSSGRMTCSLMFMGNISPRICISIPYSTKPRRNIQKKNAETAANIVSSR